MDMLTQAAWMYTVASTQPLHAHVSSATLNHVCVWGGDQNETRMTYVGAGILVLAC